MDKRAVFIPAPHHWLLFYVKLKYILLLTLHFVCRKVCAKCAQVIQNGKPTVSFILVYKNKMF